MKNNTKDKILEIIKKREQITINDLADFLGISRQIIHRHISYLIKKGLIEKNGTPPKVFYSINSEKSETEDVELTKKTRKNNF
ncbi:MAG TPA: HTH domain-containing protein [Candidatus Paceibacterota bacterium]|nr:HTH domain-containing protein [Candidatus Paceibacterota bacterium]